jgi:uncharacterized protein YlzI (FlbEa/FlbD family)
VITPQNSFINLTISGKNKSGVLEMGSHRTSESLNPSINPIQDLKLNGQRFMLNPHFDTPGEQINFAKLANPRMSCATYNNRLALHIAFTQPLAPFSNSLNDVLPTSANHQGSHIHIPTNLLSISPVPIKHPKQTCLVRETQSLLHNGNHFVVELHIEFPRQSKSPRARHQDGPMTAPK